MPDNLRDLRSQSHVSTILSMKNNRYVASTDIAILSAQVATNTANISTIQSLEPNIVNVSANYTALSGNYMISADATTASFTVTLPTASTVPARSYTTTKIDATANHVRITSASLLAGEAYHDLLFKNESLTFFSNGTYWEVK